MNEQLRGRETVLEEEVLLQFTSSSWNGFSRLMPVSGVDVRGFLVQALETELWALQEGNNLLLLTRGFAIPCTLKQSGPSTYLLAHSCRPTTDADAVNAFRDGVLIKGRWLALLPDEVPGASQGAASLYRCVLDDSSVDSGVAARTAPAIPVTNTAQQPAIIQGMPSGVARTVVEQAMVTVPPVAVQAAADVPLPVAVSVSAPAAAQPAAAPFSLNPVDMGVSSGDLPSDEGSENISRPVVSSAEPLFRLGELAPSTAPTVNTQVSMTENGSSDKVSIEYRLEGPQEAVGQLLKQQGLASQPKSELPTGSPRIPDAHETPGVMQPSAAPIPATTSRLSQWPNAVPAPVANNAGSLDAWSKPTSSVTLSQAAIDAMLSSFPASEPTPVPAPPVAAMPSPGHPPMMTPRIEVPMQQPVMTPRAEAPAMAQQQMTPAVPVQTMPFSQPVQRQSGQASILQSATSQVQSRPAAGNARAVLDEPMLSQKDIDDLIRRLSGN